MPTKLKTVQVLEIEIFHMGLNLFLELLTNLLLHPESEECPWKGLKKVFSNFSIFRKIESEPKITHSSHRNTSKKNLDLIILSYKICNF